MLKTFSSLFVFVKLNRNKLKRINKKLINNKTINFNFDFTLFIIITIF